MILGIGDNCIDYYLPPLDVKKVGGNVLNVVANLLRRGQPADYMGQVGNDDHGALILKALRDLGASCDYVQEVDGPTGVTCIELGSDDYRILDEAYGVSNGVDLPTTWFVEAPRDAAVIHTSLTGHAITVIDRLGSSGAELSCDLGSVTDPDQLTAVSDLLSRLDYVFLSCGGALPELLVLDLLRQAVAAGARCAVATRGALGCLALEGQTLARRSSLLETAPRDPLGAGDAFISGFLSARKEPLPFRADIASAWAAQACQKLGAW